MCALAPPRLPPLSAEGGTGTTYECSYPVCTEEPVRREGATGPERPKRMRPDGALGRARIFQILIQNLSGPRSGETFSKPQWEPACWLCITPIPMVPQPHFPSLRRSAHADRFAKCPPRVLRAAQPRTQPRTRTYAVYPPLRLTALAKF